ncbi:MAG: DUF4328 domain-containing protein [Actinomycetota bacterium]
MSDLDLGNPPRGWYPDPAGSSGWRYFDGDVWTDTIQADEPNVEARALETKTTKVVSTLRGWLLDLAVIAAAAKLLTSLSGREHTMQVLRFLHELWAFIQFAANHPDSTRLAPSAPNGTNVFIALLAFSVGIVMLATKIVFLVWQLRAARTAKALGYPARFSPGAGIWMWFIPLANLFLPYQALADLLPPDHQDRRLAWWAMAARVLTVFGMVFFFVAVVNLSESALTVGLCLEAAGSMAWFIVMRALVGAVALNHREFLGTSTKN